ncbi:histidine kinase [Planotetraspora phitsanulokensis]|uniref:histidine kinase n=1 Tax=Planotetraspora phitsanulokensis TaxID=575192 RepID=A0A8J3U710_9ACTN|nr:histidine kinase [Planotetraspora phitsanulokensis]GII39788.1 two-component sensor histidine kinase [Planotetraspora phitsanulokensis]
MHDPVDDPPPLDQQGIALRYLCAVLPMVFYGVILFVVVFRDRDRLVPALVDVGLGVIGLILMRRRRDRPWPVALATALLTLYSTTAVGPAQVAYVSLGTRRRWRQFISVAVVSWLALAARSSWGGVDQATVVSLATGTAVLGGLTVFSLYLRSRRDLAASQREAALAAEREQSRRIEQAKLSERVKIAQEMHDVLAHRISLLSMLAGGLAYRTDLSPEETREVALAIQQNAHQSLNELRTVLGGLRRDGAPEPPQPSLAHLDALFDEVRAAGQQLEVDDTVDDRDLLPAQTGRHAYRIVQEALTNARKHAPGSRVRAELDGRPGDGLRIRVSNPAPSGTPAGPGGRLGLVGLAERTQMAGGVLRHTVQDGQFILDAQLPWEAAHCDALGDRG